MISLKQYVLEGLLDIDIEDKFNSNTDILITAASQDYPSAKRSSEFKKIYDMLEKDISKKSPKMSWVEGGWNGMTVGDLSFFKDKTFYIMFNKNNAKSSNSINNTYDKPELSIFYVNYSTGGKPNDYITWYGAIRKQKLRNGWTYGSQNISYHAGGPTLKEKEYPNTEIYELPDEYKELWKILVEKYVPKNLSTYKEYMSYLK